MTNQEIVARFNYALETENKEVAIFVFDVLKEKANAARVVFEKKGPNIDYAAISEDIADAQTARNALLHFGAREEMFSDCNF